MKLKQLTIEGYRCFRNLTEIPFYDLTILIGENDSGKSTILRAIDLLLGKREPFLDDYFAVDGDTVNQFFIEARILVDDPELYPGLSPYLVNNELTLKKIFTKNTAFRTEILKNEFLDPDLAQYNILQAGPLQALLTRLGLPSYGNQDLRREAVREYIESNSVQIPRVIRYVETRFTDISQFLPIFQFYASNQYGDPQSLVKKTLDIIYRSHFYDETGQLKRKSLKKLEEKIKKNLNENMQELLLEKIQKYNSKVVNVKSDLEVNFATGLEFTGIALDEGQGFKLVNQKGEGSKKRLFLSILEWDKEVQLSIDSNRPVLRGYDEPDANLHFEAQRKMFYAINELANIKASGVQAVIATHSISMIDRAPAKSINHIVQEDGISTVTFLKDDNDEDIREFLCEVSEISGVSNSSIFYEKCFVLVEGASEDIALRKLYRRHYNKSIVEDGIVLINLESNGAWRNFLKLLNKNKKDATLLFLDTDTQNVNSGAQVTVARLNEIGFDADFMRDNVMFAGVQEFEDMFPDKCICEAMNALYPKGAYTKWKLKDIRAIRANNQKISKGIDSEVLKFIAHHKKRLSKPDFASKIVDLLKEREVESLVAVMNLFKKIEAIING